MPQRPWLSSALSVVIVLVATVALHRPDETDTRDGPDPDTPAIEPVSASAAGRLDAPTALPTDLPRPGMGALPRPASSPIRPDPPPYPRDNRSAPPEPPAPLSRLDLPGPVPAVPRR